jgi:hypothetical protein
MLSAMAFDRSATITVYLAAPPERVYAALTDATALQEWYWPASMAPKAFSHPVVGGGFGIAADGAGFTGATPSSTHPAASSSRGAGDGGGIPENGGGIPGRAAGSRKGRSAPGGR